MVVSFKGSPFEGIFFSSECGAGIERLKPDSYNLGRFYHSNIIFGTFPDYGLKVCVDIYE